MPPGPELTRDFDDGGPSADQAEGLCPGDRVVAADGYCWIFLGQGPDGPTFTSGGLAKQRQPSERKRRPEAATASAVLRAANRLGRNLNGARGSWAADAVVHALEGLREPSEAMTAAGIRQMERCTDRGQFPAACAPEHIWRAMVRAALKEARALSQEWRKQADQEDAAERHGRGR